MQKPATEDFKKHLNQHYHVPLYELDRMSESELDKIADLIWDNYGTPGTQLHKIVAKAVLAAQLPPYNPTPSAPTPPKPTITPGVSTAWHSTLISFEEFTLLNPPDRTAFFRHQTYVRFVYAMGSSMGGADGGYSQATRDQIADVTKWCNSNVEGLWTHTAAENLTLSRTKTGDPAYFRIRFLFEKSEDFKKFTNTYLVLKKLSMEI